MQRLQTREDVVCLKKKKKKKGNHLVLWKEAVAKASDPGEIGWDPMFQSFGCCDKDLDFNPIQWVL